MTVSELIDLLEIEDPDAEVRHGAYDHRAGEYKLSSISVEEMFVTSGAGETCSEERSERYNDGRALRMIIIR